LVAPQTKMGSKAVYQPKLRGMADCLVRVVRVLHDLSLSRAKLKVREMRSKHQTQQVVSSV